MDVHVQAMRKYQGRLLRWPNVIGVGIGRKFRNKCPTDREAVIVLVTKKLPETELSSFEILPATLGPGIMTDVVEAGEVRMLAPSREEIAFRHGRQRPAPGGVSIGHRDVTAGTLGVVVRDAASGDPLILSNNHVLVSGGSAGGGLPGERDLILQPAPYDGGVASDDVIAHLHRYVPIHLETEQATCQVARRFERGMNALFRMLIPGYCVQLRRQRRGENLVDAAVAAPVSPDVITDEIHGIGLPAGTSDPEVGMRVKKSGRSTGLNAGEITAVRASIRVKMGEGQEALFRDQIITDPLAQPGDSGSVLVDADDRIVGLLSAGSARISVASRMDNVSDLLDVEI